MKEWRKGNITKGKEIKGKKGPVTTRGKRREGRKNKK